MKKSPPWLYGDLRRIQRARHSGSQLVYGTENFRAKMRILLLRMQRRERRNDAGIGECMMRIEGVQVLAHSRTRLSAYAEDGEERVSIVH